MSGAQCGVLVASVCATCSHLVFFFSSRRRHTRCSRDWSSDVCSSDLPPAFHVLTPGSGGTITSPLSGTGVDVKVSYGATGDTHSPPFVDYTNDIAYVAADNGKLYKFTGVFLGTPTLVTTGGWPVTIATGGNSVNLTGPV